MKVLILILIKLISLSTEANCDINADGKGDKLFVENKVARLIIENQEVFSSNPEYDVKEVFCKDFDNDNKPEIALSLWKKGNFGNSKPFWIKENDDSYKMHLFLYKYENGKIKPFWHSSNLARQNLKLFPINKGFIAIEKSYENFLFSISMPIWKSWGFEIEKQIYIN